MNKILKLILLFSLFFLCKQNANAIMSDFMQDSINPDNALKPAVNNNYDYRSTKVVPITLEITERISTKDKNLYEGKIVNLKVKKPVFYGKTPILHAGQIVKAKVYLIIPSGMNGIPYEIVLSDFQIPDISESKLMAEYTKDGFNRSFFVFPLKWALTFLPPTGSLTNFIKGGHAKITPKDEITIFYYPEWN